MHMWWGFVAESGRQSDTCMLLSFVRVLWYVCGCLFLAKCSFRSDSTVLSFMSVCVCWAVLQGLASIFVLISAHPLFLPWYSFMHGIQSLAVSALCTLYILCSLS